MQYKGDVTCVPSQQCNVNTLDSTHRCYMYLDDKQRIKAVTCTWPLQKRLRLRVDNILSVKRIKSINKSLIVPDWNGL